MAGVVTDVAAMQAAANHVESVNGELHQLLGGLRNEVEGSRVSWEGEAQASFQALMLRYDDASRRLHERLGNIAELIRQNGRGYDTTNQDFTSTLGGVDVGGGSLNLG
ncbi:WXG100 family type VII secretion target [Skermania piniformis]|uniref:ESAT-6-like protein n=1 Tax=Skermania pinensis TaxID=39122 RepID=A0ABX8SA26_9ACTN|nr:WXG100 family type VII secretion target [Skermania piniformis]QXQ14623.1 WXG100 family type VII secretion target [Skermania piniformis]